MKVTMHSRYGTTTLAILLLLCLTGCHKPSPAPAADDASSTKAAASADKADKTEKSDKPDAADDGVPVVKIETARLGTIEKLLPLSGTLMAARDREATISSPVAGVLDRFSVHIGDMVQKGEVIAHLSTAPLMGQIQQSRAGIAQYDIAAQQATVAALQQQGQTHSAVLQAQAAVSAARANVLGAQATLTANQSTVTNAQQNLNRAKALFDQGLVAQKDVEAADLAARTAAAQVEAQKQVIAGLAETLVGQRQAVAAAEASRLQDAVKRKDIEIARAQRANAQGALTSTEAQIALYTVRAPIGGVVTAVNAGLGESVDTATKILTIANLDRLQLNVAVPSASSGSLHIGQALTFTVDSVPGRTFRAAIQTIGTQVDSTNGTIVVIAKVDNTDHRLKDDSSVRVGLVVARHLGSVLVPRSAVFFEAGSTDSGNGSASVFKIDAENTVHKVSVEVGFTEGDLIEITSGLKLGDHVASTGAYGLAEGTKVKPAEDADAKPDNAADKPSGVSPSKSEKEDVKPASAGESPSK